MVASDVAAGMDTAALYRAVTAAGAVTNLGIGWLYAGFVFNMMFVGIVFFIERATSQTNGHMNYKSIYVLCLASLIYMIQATIIKDYPLESNIVKYCYWLASTPVIIIQLCELLDGARSIAWLVLLDVTCMTTGLMAWLFGESGAMRWVLYSVSCTCAALMFAIIAVLFYVNHHLLAHAGYIKEQTLYNLIALIYFSGWSIFPLTWLFGFEGVGMMNEDGLCISHVLLDLVCKDITEVLIVYVSYLFNLRLAAFDNQKKKTDGRFLTEADAVNKSVMASRIPRHTSVYDQLERENTNGLKINSKVSSVASVFLGARPRPLYPKSHKDSSVIA